MKKQCNYCGGESFETKKVEYLYRHNGKYLLVPNTPATACNQCGMLYYEASVLKEIEKHFFLIQNQQEKPDQYIHMPTKDFEATQPSY